MPYKFVHTADVHLDSPLRSLAMRNEELADLIGIASRQVFSSTVGFCIREQVDALMIVGDLFDSGQTSVKTTGYFISEMRRLDEAGIRAFITRGNHDALLRTVKNEDLPPSVKVFGGRSEVVQATSTDGGLEVAVHGISFIEQKVTENMVGKFKSPVDGAINIGLLHTSLGGSTPHDPYAPCSVDDLKSCGFDYWGLGHIHKREVFSESPMVVMPGIPQGRHINESGPKTVTLVTINDDRTIHLQEHQTSIAQFEKISVNATGHEDWRDVISAIQTAFEEERQKVITKNLVVRLFIEGTTTLAWRLRQDIDLLNEQANNLASGMEGVWLEKIEVKCKISTTENEGETASPVHELGNLIQDEVVGSDGYMEAAQEIAEDMRSQLPGEIRHILGDDEEALEKIVTRLVAEGAEDVLARLHVHVANEDAE